MSEKRHNKRHHKRLSVRFGEQECSRIAFADNFNEQGLFLRTARVSPPGVRLQLQMSTPVGDVRAEGEVAWARRIPPQMLRLVSNGGMGIRILHFVEGENVFRDYCQKLDY